MKIGFVGNANNYPFMVARAAKEQGHEVIFIITDKARLNRPEGRYKDISVPYPSWIVDLSPLDLWAFPKPLGHVDALLGILRDCDAIVLNEFFIALSDQIERPAFALMTGTDLEVLADLRYADEVAGMPNKSQSFLRKIYHWRKTLRQRNFRRHLSRWIDRQRYGIKHATGFSYFPPGMLSNADRLLAEISVDSQRRVFFQMSEIGRYAYAPYPSNSRLVLFNVARIQWKKPAGDFFCELDYKGTDVLIRGLGKFVREARPLIEIRLVRKGADLASTMALIEEEGLSTYVTWLDELDQNDLYEEYKNADVVTDHFGDGSIGMGALDAMSVGRPVLANGTPDAFKGVFGEAPPICHAKTPDDVAAQLTELIADRESRKHIGVLSRSYVERICSTDRAAKIVIDKLKNAIQ